MGNCSGSGGANPSKEDDETELIAKKADFREFTEGYSYTTSWNKSEDVAMTGSKPNTTMTNIPLAEERPISLRELRAIGIHIQRRCKEEGWKDWEGNPLSPDQVTLYDTTKYVICH